MARGRKRMIAGWGLVGFGVVVALVVGASRWWFAWTDNVAHCRGGVSSGRAWVDYVTDERTPGRIARRDPAFLLWAIPSEWKQRDTVVFNRLFMVSRKHQLQGPDSWQIQFMLWPFALASFAAGAPLLLSGRRLRRRAKLGQCTACGYSLAGLATGAACPECGKLR